ncbi:Leucine rich repeat-containing protein [Ruminococcaceae bacterium FB2012]|nr:Leucine rich repeat-containing protein [Ruminococcaceae bacterium FB2012]
MLKRFLSLFAAFGLSIAAFSVDVEAAQIIKKYKNLTYEIYGEEIIIRGYDEGSSEINIPNTIDGLPVTQIAKLTDFSYKNKSVKSVTLPKYLRTVDAYAFMNCGMKSISMPDTVTKIGNSAFSDCDELSYVRLSNKLESIPEMCFRNDDALSSLYIGKSVKSIGWQSFYGCGSLTEAVIPASCEKIHNDAFNECRALESITILNPEMKYDDWSYLKPYGYYNFGNTVDKNLIVYCYEGSTTEEYCKSVGLKYKFIKGIKDASISIPCASYTYRGRGIKPTVTVKDSSGKKLTKGTDYTVSYSNNTNVGTATITVTGKGAYTGTLKKTFKIKPLDLSSSYAKVSIPYSSYTYSGSEIKPKVTVKFKDGDVIPASDFTLSYSNNVKVGTAAITVKGKGSNVTGTYKKTFVVKPAKNEITSLTSTKGAFKVSWKKGTAGTVGYQVQYSTDKNFKTNVHSYTSTKLSDLSENFSKVPKTGETWYVKVRSFYTKDGKASSTRYGNYSAVKSVKIK